MISIDTNVFVRILINDPSEPEQNRLARSLAKAAEQGASVCQSDCPG